MSNIPKNQKNEFEWKKPKVSLLGNLKDFVQSGHAFGKSGPPCDGNSECLDEFMIQMNPNL